MGVLMNVPYNNGKVSIGKYYQKPRYVEQDPDMIAIQGWFLGDNKAARRNYIANLAYIVLLAVSLVLAVIYA
jgi:hypothetical protein